MIDLFGLGNIKEELTQVPKFFQSNDTLGGVNNRHIPYLEGKFQKMTDRPAMAVNSCTNGIYLALKKLELNEDPVLIPPILFFGVAGAVMKAGGIPVLSATNAEGLMTTRSIEQALDRKFNGKKIKAVVPAHINGRYVELESFQNQVDIIEDTAPAFGVLKKNGKCLVSDSQNISIISFSFAKPLTAGEGGMIFSDLETAEWIRSHRYCGLDKMQGRYGIGTFEVTEPDLKFPFNALAAVLITLKLKSFEENLAKRKEIASYFQDKIGRSNAVEFYKNGNHLTYMIKTKNREKLEKQLQQNEIGCYYNHKPVYRFEAFNRLNFVDQGDQAACETYFSEVIHIPCREDLSDLEVEKIGKVVSEAMDNI